MPRQARVRWRLAAKAPGASGVEHEDVAVAAARQHVVEPAIADVIGPAVATDDPDRAADQMVDDREQVLRRLVRRQLQQRGLQLGDTDALRADIRFLDLRRSEDRLDQPFAHLLRQRFEQCFGELQMLVGGEPEAETDEPAEDAEAQPEAESEPKNE